jgi:hypothetical protein
MKILAVIPSKQRPSNISKFTIPFMDRLKIDYKIFVEPQDEESLEKRTRCYSNSSNLKGWL